MVCRSRVQPSLLREGRPDTRERRKSSLLLGKEDAYYLPLPVTHNFKVGTRWELVAAINFRLTMDRDIHRVSTDMSIES